MSEALTGPLSCYYPNEILPTTKFLVDSLKDFEPTAMADQPWLGEHVDQYGVPRLVSIKWKRGQTEIGILIPGVSLDTWHIDEYFPGNLYYRRGGLQHAPTTVGQYGNFRWDQVSRDDHNEICIPLMLKGNNLEDTAKPSTPSTFPQLTLGSIDKEGTDLLERNTITDKFYGFRGFDQWGWGVDFIMKEMKPFLACLKHQPDLKRYIAQESFVRSLFQYT